MNPDPPPPASTATTDDWETHLRKEMGARSRAFTFDMVDEPETGRLARFPKLREALEFLGGEVGRPYEQADRAALRHQSTHRRLAKIAIVAGTTSVALAIVQLALLETFARARGLAGALEAVAVLAGLAAVAVGLWAKFDRQWFIQRHAAERLRMLKFQALGQAELWCGDADTWRGWVRSGVASIADITTIDQVKQWAEGGRAEPPEPAPSTCRENPDSLRAIAAYYRWKRVEFQAAYFGKQAAKYRRQSGSMAHLGLPLFFLSIAAVVLHFASDWMAHRAEAAPFWHAAGVWSLAFAALLPLLSLGVRAWLGAFEHVRSASLFEAKRRALQGIIGQLDLDQSDLSATLRHIAHVEHFLEHEHREWLRLLLDAEWFV